MAKENSLATALSQCRESEVKSIIEKMLADGASAMDVVSACNQGMVELGNRFAAGECFIPELMFGGMIMKNIMTELGPQLEETTSSESAGTVVIGSVQHDVHDIGKDIVIMMLRGVGFEVIDLGVDVAPEKFVDAIKQHQPVVLGMSVLLTTCFKSVIATVEAIQEAGLRKGLPIMVGGAAASELLRENAQCDFYGKTAVDGMKYVCGVAGIE